MKWLLAAALTLTLALPARAEDNDWAKVVEAAKKEGSVVYFTALGGPHEDEPLRIFEQRYGVHVTKVVARASELRERVLSDYRAGKPSTDLYVVSQSSIVGLLSENIVAPRLQVPNLAHVDPSVTSAALAIPLTIVPYGLLINTRLVQGADEPKSWKDLLNPKFAGRMLSDDLRIPGAGQSLFEPSYKLFGREFHEKLAAQKPVVTRNNREAELQIARGEYAVLYPQSLPFALRLKGLPTKLIIPREGAIYAQSEFALMKDAPHPNAARLLANFFLEDETQLAFANMGVRPVVKGIAEKANPDVRGYLTAPLMGASTAEGQAESMKIAAGIYK